MISDRLNPILSVTGPSRSLANEKQRKKVDSIPEAVTVSHRYAFSRKFTSHPPTASSDTTPKERIRTISHKAGSRTSVFKGIRSSCGRSSPGKVLRKANTIGSKDKLSIIRYIPRQSRV
ncbi:hypothetical protein D3C71_1398610 [compost metagenome]